MAINVHGNYYYMVELSCVAHVHGNYYYMVAGSPHMWFTCGN